MIVVSPLEKVLDHHEVVSVGIPENDIGRERANGNFGINKLKVHTERSTQMLGVRRKPWREVTSLITPYLP